MMATDNKPEAVLFTRQLIQDITSCCWASAANQIAQPLVARPAAHGDGGPPA